MRLITVLNQCTKFKRFVFEESRLDEDGRILVSLRSRKNSRGECSGCGQLSPTYDTATDARRFEFVPVWGFSVFLVYRMRRVACNACGRVVIEKVPWSTGKYHLTDIQALKLSELLTMNLRTVKAYLLMEDFQRFWDYTYPAWAEKFLQRWCFRTMRSNIEPMKDIAKMLRRHQELILNWFRAKKQFNNGIVEGLNLKWNLTVRKAFGFRTFNALQMDSFHQLDELPEPQFTHEFY